jgi:hypothetical protein
MPISDNALTLRLASDGNLTATAIFSLDLRGTPIEGLAVYVIVPVVDTATDQTLDAYIRASTASDPATTDQIVGQMADLEQAAGEYVIPFTTNKRSIELELAVAGTSPNFSEVEAYLIHNVQKAWSRETNFE